VVQAITQAAVQHEKLTISWAITNAAERDIALGFGATGLMTSNIAELMAAPSTQPN
jgi:hypothetical protein